MYVNTQDFAIGMCPNIYFIDFFPEITKFSNNVKTWLPEITAHQILTIGLIKTHTSERLHFKVLYEYDSPSALTQVLF